MATQVRRYISRNTAGEVVREWFREYKLARRTINQRIHVIRRVFQWAAEEVLIPPTVSQELRTMASITERQRTADKKTVVVQPVSDADVDIVLPFLSSPLRSVVEIQGLTGARSSEVLSMRPGDIDRSEPTWEYTPREHKNAHREGYPRRVIPLGPRAQAVLRPFLDRPNNTYMFSPVEGKAEWYRKTRESRKSKVPPSQKN
jgi:integrase